MPLTPRTPRELEKYHLDKAKAYARMLEAERLPPYDQAQLQADQGGAMRQVLYHCTAALIAALDRRR